MPNAIKYSTSTQTLALKKGNYWIGTGDVGKGPTSLTDYWNGITPPVGGYVIYGNKGANGPSIYVVKNDSELITISNRISGLNHTNVNDVFLWFNSQNDKIIFNIDYDPIKTDGLVLNLDAGFIPSYPRSEINWYDISPSEKNGIVTNDATYLDYYIVFNGSNQNARVSSFNYNRSAFTAECWIKYTKSTANNKGVAFGIWQSDRGTDNEWLLFSQASSKSSPGQASFSIQTVDNEIYTAVDSGTQMNPFIWYCMCGVFDGSSVKIYLNGVLKGTTEIGSTVDVFETSYDIEMASYAYTEYTFCQISVARIYNRALDDNEVLSNYQAQSARFV